MLVFVYLFIIIFGVAVMFDENQEQPTEENLRNSGLSYQHPHADTLLVRTNIMQHFYSRVQCQCRLWLETVTAALRQKIALTKRAAA